MATREGDRYSTRPGGANFSRWTALPQRHAHDSETRPFFVTSEFLVFVLLLMGLAITAGSSPSVDARFFWEWATLASIAYMLSRGLAKSGAAAAATATRSQIAQRGRLSRLRAGSPRLPNTEPEGGHMAKIETPTELFVHKLGAALTMEETILGMLEDLQEEASDSTLQRNLREHHAETQQQIQNLHRIFEALGADADKQP